MIDVDKLRALLADPQLRGDWNARGCYVYRSDDPRDHRQVCRVPSVDPVNGSVHPIAAFIALSRAEVPLLLAEVVLRQQTTAVLEELLDILTAQGSGDPEWLVQHAALLDRASTLANANEWSKLLDGTDISNPNTVFNQQRATAGPKSLLDWGSDGLYDDTRAAHLHGHCHAASDGECSWRECPQRKQYESHCTLDKHDDENP
jgi:hypothetical protein